MALPVLVSDVQIPIHVFLQYMIDSFIKLHSYAVQETGDQQVEQDEGEQGADPLGWVEDPTPIHEPQQSLWVAWRS